MEKVRDGDFLVPSRVLTPPPQTPPPFQQSMFPTVPINEPRTHPPPQPVDPRVDPPSYAQSVRDIFPARNPRLPPLSTNPDIALIEGARRLPPLDPAAIARPQIRLPSISSLTHLPAPPPYSEAEYSARLSAVHKPSTAPVHQQQSIAQQPSTSTSPPSSTSPRHSVPRWPTTNPLAYYHPPSLVDRSSPAGTRTRANSVSLEDPNVRLACEGLRELSTNERTNPNATQFPPLSTRTSQLSASSQDGTLTSFIATNPSVQHWLRRYAASKSYLPVIRPAVELVERSVTSAVDSVPRTPIVGGLADASVRYFLARRPRSVEPTEDGRDAKRRRTVADGDVKSEYKDDVKSDYKTNNHKAGDYRSEDVYQPDYKDNSIQNNHPTQDVVMSQEPRPHSASTLDTPPLYDDTSSSAYSESVATPQSRQRHWGGRLAIATSGLGAAVDERRLIMLRQGIAFLRYCISQVNTRLVKLDDLLRYHEQMNPSCYSLVPNPDNDEPKRNMRPHIDAIWSQLSDILQLVMAKIGEFVSGTLPQSAIECIRTSILAIPSNFKRAHGTASAPPPTDPHQKAHSDTSEFGKRAQLVGQEILKSLRTVVGVLQDTVSSANGWRGTMGRRPNVEDGPNGAEAVDDSRRPGVGQCPPSNSRPPEKS